MLSSSRIKIVQRINCIWFKTWFIIIDNAIYRIWNILIRQEIFKVTPFGMLERSSVAIKIKLNDSNFANIVLWLRNLTMMTKMGKCKNIDIFGNSTFYLFMYVRIKPHQKVCKIKPTRCTCTHTLIELKCLQKRKLSFFTLLNYSFFGNILKEISFC